MFKIIANCPTCNQVVEIRLSAFFGEGGQELYKYCNSCKQQFLLNVSFGTTLIDQVVINSGTFKASANFENFKKAQPRRIQNKRVRMWRTIASASKRLQKIADLIAGEFPECAKLASQLVTHVQKTRERLRSEGVISDGKGN